MIDLRPRLLDGEGDPQVLALPALSVYPDPARLERRRQEYMARPDWPLLGLERAGELAGLIGLQVAAGRGTVLNIGVDGRRRHAGLGRSLLDGARGHLGLHALEAETDGEAAGFYARCGFTVTPLGERYPGTQRFRCLLDGQDTVR